MGPQSLGDPKKSPTKKSPTSGFTGNNFFHHQQCTVGHTKAGRLIPGCTLVPVSQKPTKLGHSSDLAQICTKHTSTMPLS